MGAGTDNILLAFAIIILLADGTQVLAAVINTEDTAIPSVLVPGSAAFLHARTQAGRNNQDKTDPGERNARSGEAIDSSATRALSARHIYSSLQFISCWAAAEPGTPTFASPPCLPRPRLPDRPIRPTLDPRRLLRARRESATRCEPEQRKRHAVYVY